MTTLRSMVTQAQPSAREQLAALLDEQSRRTAEWLERLPAVRAKGAASGVVLERLASTWPTDPPPRHSYADLVLATPDKQWAEDVASRLRNALSAGCSDRSRHVRPRRRRRGVDDHLHRTLPGVAAGSIGRKDNQTGARGTRGDGRSRGRLHRVPQSRSRVSPHLSAGDAMYALRRYKRTHWPHTFSSAPRRSPSSPGSCRSGCR